MLWISRRRLLNVINVSKTSSVYVKIVWNSYFVRYEYLVNLFNIFDRTFHKLSFIRHEFLEYVYFVYYGIRGFLYFPYERQKDVLNKILFSQHTFLLMSVLSFSNDFFSWSKSHFSDALNQFFSNLSNCG